MKANTLSRAPSLARSKFLSTDVDGLGDIVQRLFKCFALGVTTLERRTLCPIPALFVLMNNNRVK